MPEDLLYSPMEEMAGDGDGKKPKPKVPYDMNKEMMMTYNKKLPYDNKPAIEIAKSAATKMGVNPALLLSSAYQEGMNKAILIPDEVSDAFNNAEAKGLDTKNFPVDGFYNYGLDTFGDNYSQLKKYLPAGFESRFKTYKAMNDHTIVVNGKKIADPQPITTAAFKTNEDALIAKAAMMKMATDQINTYAKQKGITINPEDMDYFTVAAYNGGIGNAQQILDQYSQSKDKKSFIEKGETTKKGIHKNIYSRITGKKLLDPILNAQTKPTI